MKWGMWRRYFPLVLSFVLAFVTWAVSCQTTFPWCDELVLSDKSANWAVRGVFEGFVWPQTYNLLYPLGLSLAFKVFGVSHATVCGLTVLMAFLSSWAILSAGRRRGFFTTDCKSAECLFVALFWSVGNLPWIYADGRLETMTMLFSILFLDALLPGPGRSPRQALVMTGIGAFALMLTSVYMLPLLFVIGMTALVSCRAEDRSGLFRRGLVSAGAFALAYLVMAVFYVLSHEAIRFAGFYIYFNTITGFAPGSLFQRIVSGYGWDLWSFGVALLALALAAFASWKHLAVATFIIAIPLAMTALGRYAAYYSWVMCVPAVVLLAVLLARRLSTAILSVMTAVVLLGGVTAHVRTFHATAANRLARDRAANFVLAHPDIFEPGGDVVVAEDVYGDGSWFYPILRRGCNLWYRGTEYLTGPSDREKFNQGLSFLVKDPARCEEVLGKVMAFQQCMPTLPASATFLFPSHGFYEDIVPILKDRGFACEMSLVRDDDLRCEKWTRATGPLE